MYYTFEIREQIINTEDVNKLQDKVQNLSDEQRIELITYLRKEWSKKAYVDKRVMKGWIDQLENKQNLSEDCQSHQPYLRDLYNNVMKWKPGLVSSNDWF